MEYLCELEMVYQAFWERILWCVILSRFLSFFFFLVTLTPSLCPFPHCGEGVALSFWLQAIRGESIWIAP